MGVAWEGKGSKGEGAKTEKKARGAGETCVVGIKGANDSIAKEGGWGVVGGRIERKGSRKRKHTAG